ncbi:phosphoenolpyruvate--protein phosphotransferase [Emcibacter sp.]|uniref:phosphoenolpyruvate--protein phosphotransferase n=1 Tax=Emcibacter sp. TaxID=1979954 RepID=UPI002AA75B98|nr:phosphoenolpyruvate--protein phosphotransferase [Emcibacter sp.]
MTPASSAPRLLIRRLHQIMAGTGNAEVRLNQLVRLIAGNMVSEVCSVYFLRGGEMLELFATEGLKETAIHTTRLHVGEGLVGHVAATGIPLNLANAQNHPKFVYRPETGEEIYHSFLGVPILRAGNVAGVLVIQNKTLRQYSEEEVEVLQTVAMVLAELVAGGELFDPLEQPEGTLERAATPSFEGVVFSEGLAEGQAVLHEPKVEVKHHLSSNSGEELKRLDAALESLIGQIDDMMSAEDFRHHGEHREILDVYKMFARDKGWKAKISEVIETGLTAEAAVERIQTDNRSRMQQTDDPYLRERLSDLDDLSNRLIRHLVGKSGTAAADNLPDNVILVAQNMGPAELLDYDRDKLQAVILQQGAATAHVAIVARALGIPMVGQVEEALLHVQEGEKVIVDGVEGIVYFSPLPEILQSYQDNIKSRAELLASYEALRDKRAVTLDGVEIDLFINAGLTVDMDGLQRTGAKGVGLFRTEFQFMVSATMPKVDIQAEFYKSILDMAGDKPVIFRTLDIGGDKPVSFLKRDEEANPALGWRAMRISLDRPALLRYQLRALFLAAEGRDINIMFPMIADVSEFKAARSILDKELGWLDRFGKKKPQTVKVGTMLEVPSLLWQLDTLLPLVDFVSIGSNDLMQFFFACDRENPKLADRYDPLSPPALSMMKFIIDKCGEYDVPVTLCGELGGKPLAALGLLGVGLKRLSIAPASVGPVKMMIRSLHLGQLQEYMQGLLSRSDHSVRNDILTFAKDHGIEIK